MFGQDCIKATFGTGVVERKLCVNWEAENEDVLLIRKNLHTCVE